MSDNESLGFFRNPRSEIVRLLDMRHKNHYRVYNLCEEKTYDPQTLGGDVVWLPFGDHQVEFSKANESQRCFRHHRWG